MIKQLFPREVVSVTATAAMWEAPLLRKEAAAVARTVRKRRREYAAGRACARQALSALGIRDFPLLNDSDGVPIWPDGVVGSLSHCECYCGVAVARKGRIRSVGFDAEPASPLPMELRSLICSEKEIAWIKRQPPPTYGDWYKLFFCAKESTFKAFFPIVRLPFDFWELEIELQPGSNGFAVSCSSHCDVTTGQLLGRFFISDRHILTGVTIF